MSDTNNRPQGTNADEWHLFLCKHLDNRATSIDGLAYVAVQIAEAIEAERERCARIADAAVEAVEAVKTRHPVQFIPAEQFAANLARDIADAVRSGHEA